MDAVVEGVPVTGREGYAVEINALWYNAVCWTLSLAKKHRDKAFVDEWSSMPELIRQSFVDTFWSQERGYLADFVNPALRDAGPLWEAGGRNFFVRPNQVIACSLPFKMLTEEQQLDVLGAIKRHLLTPKGLRTLSPQNPLYKGRYEGDQPTRDRAYHQGTVWPWPLEHYVRACFDILGDKYLETAEEILAGFEEDIDSYGIGSIPEIYDGDPPHAQRGAISQAWSVGAILRISEMIENYRKK
jgi:predicted glycogen debranching enzyme